MVALLPKCETEWDDSRFVNKENNTQQLTRETKWKWKFFVIFNYLNQSVISDVKLNDECSMNVHQFLSDFNHTVFLWQPAKQWHRADITWFLEARADDVIKDDSTVGAAVELSAVHGWCEDSSHPGRVPAQVRKLLVRRTSLQVELGHGVRRNQTLNTQGEVIEETGKASVWSMDLHLFWLLL